MPYLNVKIIFYCGNLCFLFIQTDVNECQQKNKCGSDATCVNTIGSYKCQCGDGLVYDEGKCVKVSKYILIYVSLLI